MLQHANFTQCKSNPNLGLAPVPRTSQSYNTKDFLRLNGTAMQSNPLQLFNAVPSITQIRCGAKIQIGTQIKESWITCPCRGERGRLLRSLRSFVWHLYYIYFFPTSKSTHIFNYRAVISSSRTSSRRTHLSLFCYCTLLVLEKGHDNRITSTTH